MLLTAARLSKVLQLTLAVIKPDAVAHPVIMQALHEKILENNFLIVRCKDLMWRRQDSERFYSEHSGRFFYQRLVEFMSSGPMRAYILAREDAIQHWRELMGPTKVFRARYTSPESIRAQFGLTDTRNTTHGSDSEDDYRGQWSGHGSETEEETFVSGCGDSDPGAYHTLPVFDSPESAQREISFFFPDFCVAQWMEKEEAAFRSGQMRYDHQKQIHMLSVPS